MFSYSLFAQNSRLPTNLAVWSDVTKGRSYEHGHEDRAAASSAEPADRAIATQGPFSRRYLAVALFVLLNL
jgi:hypothetical protein